MSTKSRHVVGSNSDDSKSCYQITRQGAQGTERPQGGACWSCHLLLTCAFPTPSCLDVKKTLTPWHHNIQRPRTNPPECIRSWTSFRKFWHKNSNIVLIWLFSRWKFPLLVLSKKHMDCISPSIRWRSESAENNIKIISHCHQKQSQSQACLGWLESMLMAQTTQSIITLSPRHHCTSSDSPLGPTPNIAIQDGPFNCRLPYARFFSLACPHQQGRVNSSHLTVQPPT